MCIYTLRNTPSRFAVQAVVFLEDFAEELITALKPPVLVLNINKKLEGKRLLNISNIHVLLHSYIAATKNRPQV